MNIPSEVFFAFENMEPGSWAVYSSQAEDRTDAATLKLPRHREKRRAQAGIDHPFGWDKLPVNLSYDLGNNHALTSCFKGRVLTRVDSSDED